MDDLSEKFEEARKLMLQQLKFRHDAAELQAMVARQIRDEGDLSVRKLAERLGLSKSVTQRLLERASQPPADDE